MTQPIPWLVFLLLLPASICHATSFDCKKAATMVEKMVCTETKLSDLDDQLSSSYKDTLENAVDHEGLKAGQRAWLGIRNKCQTTACLANAYAERISYLDSFSQNVTGTLTGASGIDDLSISIKAPNGRVIKGYCTRACGDWVSRDKDEVHSLDRAYVGRAVTATITRQRNGGQIAGPGADDTVAIVTRIKLLDKH